MLSTLAKKPSDCHFACAMRGRGESYENIKLELLSLNQNCEPSLTRAEVLEIVDSVWGRYWLIRVAYTFNRF